MIRLYSALAVGLIAALLGGLGYMVFVGQGQTVLAQCRGTSISGGGGSIGGPFELVDHTGRTVTEADFEAKPTLVYFGYTFCPDVCPLDTARNAQAVDLLAEQGYDVTPVFVSVDHQRDTQDALAEYVRFMHPEMVGLTGTEAQIRAAAQAYRVYFALQETDDDFYLIDHSTFSYFLLPGHGFVDVIRRDQSPEQVADVLSCFMDNA
ncbi:SCO family protein [Roseinatronobacter monicus]|uniref:Protein SCO1/2 n=1 Tax=Roseinatronobacter monicus TaxID=393481 RepID=A0A543K9P0_9RHOB|nr:SCO family protein [Roseinatronobacter monicus]TQM91795.1 protein SCO1/2 [Roseinatronobacter monicus]